MAFRFLCIVLVASLLCSCSSERQLVQQTPPAENSGEPSYSYLAIGDSYTIGESVCGNCSFPAQLTNALEAPLEQSVSLEIIARTGWTTTDLLGALAQQAPASDQDLVTLLIGVNNQYRGWPFSTYEEELPELLEEAIRLAKGDPASVILISIPDYAYTPFGQRSPEPETISRELDRYNEFARNLAAQWGVRYVYITDITRQGLAQPEFVASDQLHPSKAAYAEFVDRLLPIALNMLKMD